MATYLSADAMPSDMPFDPDTSFGFLVSDTARLLRERFNHTAQALGLTLAQGRALLHLRRNQGISQRALAALLEVQPITLLRQIDRLEEAGLVERRPNPDDRRAQKLYTTRAAEALIEDISELGMAQTEIAMQGLADVERDQLIALLARVKQNLVTRADDAGNAAPGGAHARPSGTDGKT